MLQFVVIVGLAIFSRSQRWLVSELESAWSPRLPPHHLFVYSLAGTIVFYNALVTSLVEVGDPRYRMPVEPFVLAMCFLGFHMWRGLLGHHPSAGAAHSATATSSRAV
jgi:hypothetical protein